MRVKPVINYQSGQVNRLSVAHKRGNMIDCGHQRKGASDMKKQTLGNRIAGLRKENGMTQLELAGRMGVTDKAVSKWERDLSCPDVNSIARLAGIFGVSVDELMQVMADAHQAPAAGRLQDTLQLVLKAVAVAMGVAAAVLSLMNKVEARSAAGMLGLGLACLAVAQLSVKAQ